MYKSDRAKLADHAKQAGAVYQGGQYMRGAIQFSMIGTEQCRALPLWRSWGPPKLDFGRVPYVWRRCFVQMCVRFAFFVCYCQTIISCVVEKGFRQKICGRGRHAAWAYAARGNNVWPKHELRNTSKCNCIQQVPSNNWQQTTLQNTNGRNKKHCQTRCQHRNMKKQEKTTLQTTEQNNVEH